MYVAHDQVGSDFPAIFMIWLNQQILALGRQLRRTYVLSRKFDGVIQALNY